MSQTIGHHRALIYVMITISVIDATISDTEIERIKQIVNRLPVFQDFDEAKLPLFSRECLEILNEDDGMDAILALAADALPPQLHETAYALAVEVAAVDLTVRQEEIRFLQRLRDALHVDKLACAAIERGAMARHAQI